MTVTIAEPEVLAEDAAPIDTAAPAPEGELLWISELDLAPHGYIEIPIDALIVHPGNVRRNLNVTAEFVASIKAEGIIQPLEITPGMPASADRPQATYNLIDGHRRLAGARKAKRETVPCFFKTARADDVAGQYLDMAITSRHKEKLTTQEEANALFAAHEAGADLNRLSKAYGKKDVVSAALKAAKLPTQTQRAAAALEYPWTMDELAALAEFADDAEATARLLEAVDDDRFVHQVQRERTAREEQAARDKIREELKTAGVTLYEYDDAPAGLVRLDTMPTKEGKGVEPEAHQGCAGHIAVFERWRTTSVFYACSASEQCEHINREKFTAPVVPPAPDSPEAATMAAAKKAEDSAKRKRVMKGNTDWRAARTVRRQWLADLIARTSLSREDTDAITRWTAENYLRLSWVVSSGINGYVDQTDLKAELLGVKNPNWSELTAKASAKRLLLLTFLPLVTAYEKNMHDQQWRTDSRADYRSEREQAAAWLAFLMSLGYKISPIERAVLAQREYDPDAAASDPLRQDDADVTDPASEDDSAGDDLSAEEGDEQDDDDPAQDDPDPDDSDQD